MTGAKVNAIVSVIRSAGELVSRIYKEVYEASDATECFPIKVKILEDRYAKMIELLRRVGMSNEEAFKGSLDVAEKLLEKELSRCENLQRLKRERLIFPHTLSTAIDNLNDVIESILKQLEENQKMRQLLDSEVCRKVSELPFSKDPKYVTFATTMKLVRDALESTSGGRVVTLYGGTGEGKTGLAKHLAVLYRDAASRRERDQAPVAFSDGSFFLQCEARADAESLLVALSESLGFHIREIWTGDENDPRTSSNQSVVSLTRLKSQLQRRLKYHNILIVLDNVWETSLVQELLIDGAPGVKYLITSVIKDLWPDATCPKIPIDKPTLEEGRQIVANHILCFRQTSPPQLEDPVEGFAWKLPDHLKDEVDQIIEKCLYNPLDLVNVASLVDNNKAFDLSQWVIARKKIRYLEDGNPRRGPVLFGTSYSKGTMSNATEWAIDTFAGDTRTILSIAGVFETEHVPEVVFRLFFKSMHSKLSTFSGCSSDLEGSSFIERYTDDILLNVTWSIHSKRRAVILEKLKKEIEYIASKILEPPSTRSNIRTGEAELLLALLFLYGRESYQKRAAQQLNISSVETIDEIEFNDILRNSRARKVMEPFVLLLDADPQDETELEVHVNAKEVIMQFLRSGKLHDHVMSKLID